MNPRRRPAGRAGGRPSAYCDRVWSYDGKDKPVTCARLDEAQEAWTSVYGGDRPLSRLDQDAFAELVATARMALGPLADGLAALDDRLDEEVNDARGRAETAEQQAVLDRADTEAARAARAVAEEQARNAVDERDTAVALANTAVSEKDRAVAAAQRDRTDMLAAQGRAAALTEQITTLTAERDTAITRAGALATGLATVTAERDAATAARDQLAADLRDVTTAHRDELAALRGSHDLALARIRQEDADSRDALRRDLAAERDRDLIALAARHDAELARLGEQQNTLNQRITELTATAGNADSAREAAEARAVAAARGLAALRESLLMALADAEDAAGWPDRVRALLADDGGTQ